ncbi:MULTISPECIES: 4-hydroxythreonine-4-phosphate dehydrogenase PdxA [Pseudanabaena]|uniref:4-hydroxythreonine-4-phosphate dehydrogenase n=2 Tax=Pseudanabaena TaxID=1152 RepID=L8MUQ9_9CYAN|nr:MULTISPECIES: 4-hydroxythreonine-4-phosphate dehydrogenase PdxA [Pseudanabaena]ELS31201.1 4-hydroxythreonine-4-phosphate dehydrogenase [Pseudanabaena biceps PCC 7429]MDG3496537.1 4-hydroxythreonine-4-phosphate dehydrogenase PdxA [Pseudanabaena catenata USMAC16]
MNTLRNSHISSVAKSHSSSRARIALTIGDPAGIGTEIILKSLATRHLDGALEPNLDASLDRTLARNLRGLEATFTIFGDRRYLQETYNLLINHSNLPLADPEYLEIVDICTEGDIALGIGNRASGAASFAYLDAAITATLAGDFDAIVTAPISKSAWKQAGHHYAGQTELLAERSQVDDFGMLFVGKSPHTDWVLRTLLATVHIPLQEVTQRLTPELIEQKLELLRRSLWRDFGIANPRIAIAGINPHSGEQGQLGREELEWLQPAIERYRQQHPNVQLSNPIPPDTMWLNPAKAWHDRDRTDLGYDAYLAMYHDQGLIPVKLLAFDRAVNTTIGLPFVRTSPDHGTAFDIAGKGIADPASTIEAIALAVELANIRKLAS